ncbi:MAG TPA: YciI family protein [Polyangiaceae bacterium]|nr:YciI family protein [Polyangiaceae bacterium]
MRFMVMHKNDKHTEAGEKPGPELMARMGEYIGEHVAKGQFLDGAGLGPSATRTRLTFRDGASTIEHGPYAGVHELVSAILLLVVRSRDEAIAWAERYGKVLGDGELELGPLNEPWDLGLMPKPADAPLRVLLLHKADRDSEAGQGSSPRQKAALTRLKNEMTKAGVLKSLTLLEPSSKSKRLRFVNNAREIIDGPFSESKELIGGYALLELSSMDAAIAECTRYVEILGGTLEIDIRPLAPAEASP